MEDLGSKIDRIVSDVDKLVDLYDFAEKLYPYDKIRNQREVIVCIDDDIYRWMKMNKEKTK